LTDFGGKEFDIIAKREREREREEATPGGDGYIIKSKYALPCPSSCSSSSSRDSMC